MRFGVELELLQDHTEHSFDNSDNKRLTFAQNLNKTRKDIYSVPGDLLQSLKEKMLNKKYYHFRASKEYHGALYENNAIPTKPKDYAYTWVIEYDSSVRLINNSGDPLPLTAKSKEQNTKYNPNTEFVSPPLTLWKFKPKNYICDDFGPMVLNIVMREMFKSKFNIATNDNTSVHVHISCVDEKENYFTNPRYLLSVCLNWIKYEGLLKGLINPKRRNNWYAKSIQMDGSLGYKLKTLANIAKITLKDVVEGFNDGTGYEYRFKSLNLQNLIDGIKTIEVRIHHGTIDPLQISCWCYILTLFFNHVMTETRAVITNNEQYHNYITSLIDAINNMPKQNNAKKTAQYKEQFNSFFDNIIRSDLLKSYYYRAYQKWNPNSDFEYSKCGTDIIETSIKNSIKLIFSKVFWNDPFSLLTEANPLGASSSRSLMRTSKSMKSFSRSPSSAALPQQSPSSASPSPPSGGKNTRSKRTYKKK
jgi:hypothetical protein